MPYQPEEEAKLGQRLSKEAIALAIQGKWEEAVAVNKSIIENFPTNVEAYNRLGKALTELEDFVQAKEAYLKALELAPNNAIAKKNLARLNGFASSIGTTGGEPHPVIPRPHARKVIPELFTAEAGKSGIVNLHNLASGEALAGMGYGTQVQLTIKGQRLIVENNYEEYLGEVEPRHALRLIKLIGGGNTYAAAILRIKTQQQSPHNDEVQILIKETYQAPSQIGRLSFPSSLQAKRSEFTSPAVGKGGVSEQDRRSDEMERPEGEIEHLEGYEEILPEGFSLLHKEREITELEE